MNDPDDDMQACEACGAEGLADNYTTMEGCGFCPACTAEWEEAFAACSHEWAAATNDAGEPAGYCGRCAGIVALKDFPALGFDVAAVAPVPS